MDETAKIVIFQLKDFILKGIPEPSNSPLCMVMRKGAPQRSKRSSLPGFLHREVSENNELSTHRPLHIWATDFHSATIRDLHHLLEPLGVIFYDQSLSSRCKLFNNCAHNLTIINEKNGVYLNHSLIPKLYDRYKDDWQMQQVNAFVCYHPTSLCPWIMRLHWRVFTLEHSEEESKHVISRIAKLDLDGISHFVVPGISCF
ncbi:hypothetical protein CAPTEDRAFT_203208 [Capitella teleta]|uniref:Uncharacterized protein n=1 Tax=Capitella teleta TaxID=283909 RepID=R7U0Y7_CAPTE|nr:hypothetical protein CAPTEDRAFT_203208 [Capitella teleta]|eukprot:ELT96845.1 hypothetical protein CAPTEDRAFT_203208 [Capitella teleta]